ncbi:hypothetical protein [Modestobacter marinus]|uniref:hypothetical protein n=1 Tax=Modestobacter marinus TaxID=477641 RepID=UPI001C9495D7|nr:hypothetical protein [Modestobacter marinus]
MSEDLRLEIEPVEDHGSAWAEAVTEVLRRNAVTAGDDVRLLRVRVDDPEDKDGRGQASGMLVAEAYDYTTENAVRVQGPVRALEAGDLESFRVEGWAYQPAPSQEELDLAFEAVRNDDQLRPLIEAEGLQPYAPMPPVAGPDLQDGRSERVLPVGLVDQRGITRQFVGVRLRDRLIVADLPGVPRLEDRACEPSPPFFGCPFTGTTGQVWVSVFVGATRIWRFLLVRPAASSGTNGSGVELRFVDYRDHRVLYRAHVPILNVEYFAEGQQAGCGPTYRDWQNQETCFDAPDGSDPVPGIRVCPTPARTIIESGSDVGNFRGAAIYVEGTEVVIVSELAAGWYRYISQWRLAADGTIRPRFGFAAAANTCTCLGHHHHVYWRLDLDVDGISPNRVEEFNNPPIVGTGNWHVKSFEIRRARDPGRQRHWRVSNPQTGASYLIVPGSADGNATGYGVGDLWVLQYRGNEIDDGQPFTTDPNLSRARIDSFAIPAEPVTDRDVVLWYSAHFLHDEAHGHPGGGYVGPDLSPERWPG